MSWRAGQSAKRAAELLDSVFVFLRDLISLGCGEIQMRKCILLQWWIVSRSCLICVHVYHYCRCFSCQSLRCHRTWKSCRNSGVLKTALGSQGEGVCFRIMLYI